MHYPVMTEKHVEGYCKIVVKKASLGIRVVLPFTP